MKVPFSLLTYYKFKRTRHRSEAGCGLFLSIYLMLTASEKSLISIYINWSLWISLLIDFISLLRSSVHFHDSSQCTHTPVHHSHSPWSVIIALHSSRTPLTHQLWKSAQLIRGQISSPVFCALKTGAEIWRRIYAYGAGFWSVCQEPENYLFQKSLNSARDCLSNLLNWLHVPSGCFSDFFTHFTVRLRMHAHSVCLSVCLSVKCVNCDKTE